MKVFISWSGDLSGKLGNKFHTWLPSALQLVKPYYTPSDIKKGAVWHTEITKELADSKIGVLCLTPENLNSPWLLFEAGALSNKLDKSHVCPILFGVDKKDLNPPLDQFQLTSFDRIDIFMLFGTINSQLADNALSESVLREVFDKWWPDLESGINKILSEHQSSGVKPTRTTPDMLEEILELTRILSQKSLASQTPTIHPKALTHLLQCFRIIHDAVKLHLPDDEIMENLKEMSKVVIYLSEHLSSGSEHPALINDVKSLKYVCNALNTGDDIPF